MNNELNIQVTNCREYQDDFEKIHEKTPPEQLAKSLIPNDHECTGLDVAYDASSKICYPEIYEAGLNIGYGLDKLATMSEYKQSVNNKLKELHYKTLKDWAVANPDLIYDPNKKVLEEN